MWTYRHAVMEVQGSNVYLSCGPDSPVEVPPSGVIATDGSGGPHSADPRLRRCDWGFVVRREDGTTIGEGRGPLRWWKQTVPLAELSAAIEAVRCTTGDIELLVDNASVVKGINRGPVPKPGSNAFLWRAFWTAAGERQIRARKIKAHLDKAAARAGGLAPLHWAANRRADELAEEAAADAQLPAEAVEAVQEVDREAAAVHEHPTAVARHVAANAPLLYGANTKPQRAAEGRERVRQRREAEAEAERLIEHLLDLHTGRCKSCFKGPSRELPRLAFLRSPCARAPAQLHPSHRLRCTRGLWWCEACGGTGSRHFRKLARLCEPPTATGRRAMAKLQDDRLPSHIKVWPEEAAGEALQLG